MSAPDLTVAEIEAVNQVFKTPDLSIGPRIAEIRRYLGAADSLDAAVVNVGEAPAELLEARRKELLPEQPAPSPERLELVLAP